MKNHRFWVWSLGILFGGAGALALFFGAKVLGDGAAVSRQNLERTSSLELETMVGSLRILAKDWENRSKEFLAMPVLNTLPTGPKTLLERSSYFSNYVLAKRDGTITYPGNTEISKQETEFLLRVPGIISNMVHQPQPEGRQEPNGLENRWQTYFLGNDEVLFFGQIASGEIRGVEWFSSAIWSDLASWAVKVNFSRQQGTRIVLMDPMGGLFYQWGPDALGPEEVMDRTNLPGPLQGWHFSFLVQTTFLPTGPNAFHWLILILLSAVWIFVIIQGMHFLIRQTQVTEQKQSFVNQVSHELKTPLTNIRLYCELMRKRLIGRDSKDPSVNRYLEVLDLETARLSRLIHNVLSFAEKDHRKAPVLSIVDVGMVLEKVSRTLGPSLEKAGLKVEMQNFLKGPCETNTDLLEQVLGNLLSNAEKYASEGAWVGIFCTPHPAENGPGWTVRVEDKGDGIPASQQEKVFKAFTRLHDRTTDPGGTGLGLTIAADTTTSLGGELILESPVPHLGKGCRFTLVFSGGYHG